MRIEPAAALVGAAAVPGNKGSSQRAVLLGAVADGESRIRGFGRAADTLSAVEAARDAGCRSGLPRTCSLTGCSALPLAVHEAASSTEPWSR